jgi:hypothetical protein
VPGLGEKGGDKRSVGRVVRFLRRNARLHAPQVDLTEHVGKELIGWSRRSDTIDQARIGEQATGEFGWHERHVAKRKSGQAAGRIDLDWFARRPWCHKPAGGVDVIIIDEQCQLGTAFYGRGCRRASDGDVAQGARFELAQQRRAAADFRADIALRRPPHHARQPAPMAAGQGAVQLVGQHCQGSLYGGRGC